MLVWTGALLATDPVQLALALKAQTDFDRVELSPTPQLSDSENCVQSQAAALSVSAPEELALIYFRKAYCALTGATVTGATPTRRTVTPAASGSRAGRCTSRAAAGRECLRPHPGQKRRAGCREPG